MKKIISAFLLLGSLQFISAQNIVVNQVVQLTGSEEQFFFPRFSTDGTKIYFTKANYKGIYEFNRASKKITQITDEAGAGYDFVVSDDGQIVYRSDKFENGKRYSSLKVLNSNNRNIVTVEEDKRDLSIARGGDGSIYYTLQKNLNVIEGLNNSAASRSDAVTSVVFIENSKMAFYSGGAKKILSPLGGGNYIWPSLSPDNSKILFTLAGRGTYISDVEGNIITEIGYANAPVWSPDGKWITYMVDKDNGEIVTSSDLFITSADGTKTFQLTNSTEKHEMYPRFSHDGNEIIFHSDDGIIFLMNLNITD